MSRDRLAAGAATTRSLLVMGLALASLALRAAELPLAQVDSRFTPRETPVCMEYDVGYRLCNIDLKRVAAVRATTTIGLWRHRVTGESVPAIFLDMRVDSPDGGRGGRRNRISIHDRIVAVMTVPGMQALLFAKYTDESLRPLIHASESLGESIYDTQSGQLDFTHREILTGLVSTNLQNREALLELSRRIHPVMQFLVDQYRQPTADAATSEHARIVANLDGKAAALRILTSRERSPGCLARQRLDCLYLRTVAEKGSSVKPRDFHAWTLTFEALAKVLNDARLVESAHSAPVETVVPVVMDYELALGSVRVTMKSIHLGAADAAAGGSVLLPERPEAVREK